MILEKNNQIMKEMQEKIKSQEKLIFDFQKDFEKLNSENIQLRIVEKNYHEISKNLNDTDKIKEEYNALCKDYDITLEKLEMLGVSRKKMKN